MSALVPQAQLEAVIPTGHRGKTVLVTGGATGLGRAICLDFGRLGCDEQGASAVSGGSPDGD